MKRVTPTTAGGVAATPCLDLEFSGAFPELLLYLTDPSWDDGSSRELASLSLTIEGGLFKLALNDRAQHRTMYLTSQSIREGLELMEDNLASGRGDWRAWNVRTKAAARKQ